MDFVYLTDIPIFSMLTTQETAMLQRQAARKTFPAQRILQLEGQSAYAFMVLTHGRAKAVLTRDDGKEILLHFYTPGDFFGEMNLSDITACPYTIVAVDALEVIVISRTAMIALVKQNGAFAFQMLSFVSQRLYHTQNRLRDIIYQRGDGKILKYFENIAAQIGMAVESGTWIPEKFSHQVIADACGLTRETVTRLLRQLHKDGRLQQEADGWLLLR